MQAPHWKTNKNLAFQLSELTLLQFTDTNQIAKEAVKSYIKFCQAIVHVKSCQSQHHFLRLFNSLP